MLVYEEITMAGLYLVRKPIPESDREARSPAAGPLQQLAAIDRASEGLYRACRQLSTVTDRATQLQAKLQRGTETFLAAWNAAHPEQIILGCRGAATGAACARYTTNPQALCDACRARLTRG